MSNRLAAVTVALIAALALSACANTVRGVGRDVGNTVDATGAAANDIAR
jgi:predicted small secreted protein